jgi:hypothetical protein
MISASNMNMRTIHCILVLALSFLASCALVSSPSGPVTSKSDWAAVPSFDSGHAPGKRIYVSSADPGKSGIGAELAKSFTETLTAKGYESVASAAEADLLCVLVVRYFGRTLPPDGYVALLAQAGDTILGGDESWLAADGSGYDTQSRKVRGVRFRSGSRSRISEVFRGHQDDEFTLLIDVAIGARTQGQRQVVQRHEGRLWSSCTSLSLDRTAAKTALMAELQKRWSETLP